MISNLQQKLNMVSTHKVTKPKKETLDFKCSVFENSYRASQKIGDVILEEIYNVDINNLKDVCFAKSDEDLNIEDVVFFDTETTGLAGGSSTVAFLIGVGYFENNQFICKQFLMNDYYQEKDMLEKLCGILETRKAVISYNGKSFDSHIINTRSILNRMKRPLNDMVHLDLLHAVRRLYKKRIQRCSLGNIEKQILKIEREGDISGALIPEVFFSYVKYGDDSMLETVISHNLQDIVNMCGVVVKLLEAYEKPLSLEHNEDIYSQGVIFERLGYREKAKVCYNDLENYQDAIARLAYLAKTQNDYEKAVILFTKLSIIQIFDPTSNIEIAKLFEHKLKDLDSALEHTNIAINKARIRLSSTDYKILESLEIRKVRILKKKNLKIGENIKCLSQET